MDKIKYLRPGAYLFRFLDHRAGHFWATITDMLSEQRLFLNSRTKFNDPYDSQPIIETNLSSSAIHEYVKDSMDNPYNPKRSIESITRLLQMKATGRHLDKKNVERFKVGLREHTNTYLDRAGILSFSLVAEHPLLWGHYAASFAGVCAIFRRGTSNSSALSICAEVAYVADRPRLPISLFNDLSKRLMTKNPHEEIANEIFFRSFLHKSNYWAYEHEARIFYPNYAFKKLPFEANELKGSILGPNSSAELENKIREEIKARRPSVGLHRASLSKNRFQIIIPQEFTLIRSHAA